MMATADAIVEEAKRARKVTQIVDITTALIRQSEMSRHDAELLVAHVREEILRLFPGSEKTYEVIYSRRFTRLVEEYTRRSPDRPPLS